MDNNKQVALGVIAGFIAGAMFVGSIVGVAGVAGFVLRHGEGRGYAVHGMMRGDGFGPGSGNDSDGYNPGGGYGYGYGGRGMMRGYQRGGWSDAPQYQQGPSGTDQNGNDGTSTQQAPQGTSPQAPQPGQ